ncbi:MAG: hypothetical protein IJE26_06550 [Oscillospiraceae bacterium]|nr:hypothetical protein [Oscillospiraceae bacterium]
MHAELNPERKTKWAFFLAAVCALAVFLLLQVLLTCGTLQDRLPGMPEIGNLPAYVLTLLLFAAAFCVFLLLFRQLPMTKTAAFMETELTEKAYKPAFTAGCGLLFLLLAVRRLFMEKMEFASAANLVSFNFFPLWLAIPLFLAVVGAAIFFVRKLSRGWDVSRRILYISTAVILLLNFFTTLILNLFRGDIHHGVAYLESVYNVFYAVPYTHLTVGVYGFYGLFLAPVLRLFGGHALPLLITMTLLQCLCVLLCMYCIWYLVKENFFRICTLLMCCLSLLSMRIMNYWQVQPHRVLWPLILVAFVLHLIKHDRWRKRDRLLGFVLCTAAILWNVESGLFCGIAFAAACIVHDWQEELWYRPRTLLKALLHIGCVIVTVAAAILIVNGYNYLCGWREWFLKDFFFPMFESSYMVDTLEANMPVGNHAWVYVLILFGSLLLGSLYMTSFVHRRPTPEAGKLAPLMMAVAMLGLCSFSYYANRAAYRNLDIVIQLAGIAICLLWRAVHPMLHRRSGTREDCGKAIIACVSTVLVVALAIEAVLFSAPLLLRKLINNHYETRSYREACQWIEETIPENTFAFGGGISMLYAELGWDPIGHYRDASDWRIAGGEPIEAVATDALEQDAFVAYITTNREEDALERILSQEPDFVLTEEVTLIGKVLQYYTRAGK